MLQVTHLAGFGAGPQAHAMNEVLLRLGLTANLKLCLDAGDYLSYTSGQSWLDRSGNGYDFFLGASDHPGTGTAAPVFTGPAGSPSAYWLFNSSYFTYDSANETWMENLHKDNAIFSAVFFFYRKGTTNKLFGMNGTGIPANGIGSELGLLDGIVRFKVGDGSGSFALDVTSDSGDVDITAWNMIGISIDEATGSGGGFIYVNGAYSQVGSADTFDASYTSPSASNATDTMQIGARGNGINPASDGSRMGAVAIFEGAALTKAQFDLIWAAMRGRFGI